VISTLVECEIPYEIIQIDPSFADTAVFCQQYGYSIDFCGNTIVVASKREPKQYAACVVRGSDRLDVNRAVKRLLGVSRLSFA
jgi:prolyl-tRNA editing enzyme YbaK/EbsC (Cys-tRNA(Pro) deacylase)